MAAPPDLRFREQTEPVAAGFAVTPSNTVDFPSMTRGIYIGTVGNVAVVWEDGSVSTLVAPTLGVIHPIRARRINSTGTTAGSILGMY